MSFEFDTAVQNHDAAISAHDLEIWIGAEPTFTLRESEDPQWLSEAMGNDKQDRALNMAQKLNQQHKGSILLRSVGRQYSDEPHPRWSYGIFERRDQIPVWQGPPDPACLYTTTSDDTNAKIFSDALTTEFNHRQWTCKQFSHTDRIDEARLLLRFDNGDLDSIESSDPRLSRKSIHEKKTPASGLIDSLAVEGYYLFVIKTVELSPKIFCLSIELPAFTQVTDFLQCLSALESVAKMLGIPHLLIQGYPPPVDQTVSWTTITPDPAVIEINLAPQPNISSFYAIHNEIFEIANKQGLSPYRLQYNGNISDSGGGGQFTIGGPTPQSSPFLLAPKLLPRLVRYVIRHPALSYLFATTYVGSNSQSCRSDEGLRDIFHELGVSLEQLENQTDIPPEFLHASLAPFLADPSGNSHRSELNIEKLWNPFLPVRGCLGLLEFRAFRMPLTPQRSAAIALLLRAIIGMLVSHDPVPKLHDWGDELHDRFALPYFLNQDLENILSDLDLHGFGLDETIQSELFNTADRPAWTISFEGCQLSIQPAIEFWPLVGDVASQESGGSRLVDASTQRMQISLQHPGDSSSLSDWQLQTPGFTIPLQSLANDADSIRIIGLRFRDFTPYRGLHPLIPAMGPLVLYLFHKAQDKAIKVSLHNWRHDGQPYEGLPIDFDEAEHRRNQRLVVERIKRNEIPQAAPPPDTALTNFTLDLRRL